MGSRKAMKGPKILRNDQDLLRSGKALKQLLQIIQTIYTSDHMS